MGVYGTLVRSPHTSASYDTVAMTMSAIHPTPLSGTTKKSDFYELMETAILAVKHTYCKALPCLSYCDSSVTVTLESWSHILFHPLSPLFSEPRGHILFHPSSPLFSKPLSWDRVYSITAPGLLYVLWKMWVNCCTGQNHTAIGI